MDKEAARRTPMERTSPDGKRYHFRLFVAGGEPNSVQAKENLRRLCETYLEGRYDIEVIDVLEDYRAALVEDILVTPALILVAPPPRVTIFGTLRDTDKVCAALRLSGETTNV